jgi:hypothetical protein
MRLSAEAREVWNALQRENRRQIEAVNGIDPASEIYGSMLAASPVKTLKLAMIFEACRWLKDKTRDWRIIAEDTLALAATHEAGCVEASRTLDGTVNRGEIQDEADAIDTLNREADRIYQERHRHCEPDLSCCAAEFA